MNKELIAIEHEIKKDCIPAFERLLTVLMESGIHVYSIRSELLKVEKAMKE